MHTMFDLGEVNIPFWTFAANLFFIVKSAVLCASWEINLELKKNFSWDSTFQLNVRFVKKTLQIINWYLSLLVCIQWFFIVKYMHLSYFQSKKAFIQSSVLIIFFWEKPTKLISLQSVFEWYERRPLFTWTLITSYNFLHHLFCFWFRIGKLDSHRLLTISYANVLLCFID